MFKINNKCSEYDDPLQILTENSAIVHIDIVPTT